jgi:hypothetical protein
MTNEVFETIKEALTSGLMAILESVTDTDFDELTLEETETIEVKASTREKSKVVTSFDTLPFDSLPSEVLFYLASIPEINAEQLPSHLLTQDYSNRILGARIIEERKQANKSYVPDKPYVITAWENPQFRELVILQEGSKEAAKEAYDKAVAKYAKKLEKVKGEVGWKANHVGPEITIVVDAETDTESEDESS